MDNNTTSAPKFDICDSLDEYADIRKQQGALADTLTRLNLVWTPTSYVV